jgi:hypothetical protein
MWPMSFWTKGRHTEAPPPPPQPSRLELAGRALSLEFQRRAQLELVYSRYGTGNGPESVRVIDFDTGEWLAELRNDTAGNICRVRLEPYQFAE